MRLAPITTLAVVLTALSLFLAARPLRARGAPVAGEAATPAAFLLPLVALPPAPLAASNIDGSIHPEAATRAYLDQLTPEKKARSDAYFQGGYWLQLWGFLYGAAVYVLVLHTGVRVVGATACALRSPANLARRSTHRTDHGPVSRSDPASDAMRGHTSAWPRAGARSPV